MLKKDQAVCIRTVDYSETSQIVTLFSRASGKISGIAKGAKRPKSAFAGPIEVFSCGQIVFAEPRSSRLCTLTEFEQSGCFSGLRKNLYALNSGLFAAELVNSFTTDLDPHPGLYDSFVSFLQDCQTVAEKNGALKLLIVFQLDLLRNIGSAPVLDRCANCKRAFSNNWRQVYFSSEANGFICRDCEAGFADKMKLSRRAAECLNDLKLLDKAGRAVPNEIEKVLIYHFTELLHHPPKMAKYFLAT